MIVQLKIKINKLHLVSGSDILCTRYNGCIAMSLPTQCMYYYTLMIWFQTSVLLCHVPQGVKFCFMVRGPLWDVLSNIPSSADIVPLLIVLLHVVCYPKDFLGGVLCRLAIYFQILIPVCREEGYTSPVLSNFWIFPKMITYFWK